MSDQTITSLIEKLEGAETGSLELDADVALQVGWTVHPGDNWIGPHAEIAVPDYTTSLDAALALAERVLDGDCSYDLFHDFGGFNRAKVHGITNAPVFGEGKAETMPLALCAALLRAQSEAGPTGEDSPANSQNQDPRA